MPLTAFMMVLLPLAAAPHATPAKPANDDLAPVIVEAIRLYDQGDYDQAKVDLKGLDAAGAADGPLLYRLFFCERATGHEEDAQKALDRARAVLEKENATPTSIETPFYLANAYANLGKPAEAQSVARDATAKIEAGTLKTPDTPIGSFQVGKLYQDANKPKEAIRAYEKALAGFDLKDGRYASNARWALRYIGGVKFSSGDYAGSEQSFDRLTKIGDALSSDWSALGSARERQGHYAPAAAAWKSAVKLDPGGADDARYAARLAETAATIAPLPTASAGVDISSMTAADLEAALKTQAQAARDAQKKAFDAMKPAEGTTTPRKLDPAMRKKLAEDLAGARRLFVATGLEYAVRHQPLRETAFREGYAVLVFQDTEWQLPPDPPPASPAKGS